MTRPAPRSFEAIATSTSTIKLFWLPAQGATGYGVERDGKPLATLSGADTSYADKDLAPDSTHRYTLHAIFEGGESAPRSYTERTFAPFPRDGGRRGKMPEVRYDVVIAQASSGGVAAAFEAGRRGLKVALLEPTTRLGGMPVNGLSATDLRRPEHASGFLTLFRDRVRAIYVSEGERQATGLMYEPRVAHQAMKSLLYSVRNVSIFRRARLARVRTIDIGQAANGSRRTRVEAVEAEELDEKGAPTGRRALFYAMVFIDATDCGDLAAWAGAPFRLGREPRTRREPHAGVIYYDRAHDRRLPGSTGAGDKRIQSYAYLLVVKDYGPGVDRTIPKPEGYRKEDYTHDPAWKDSWAVSSGKLPGDKYELNQHPEGGDLQEINYRYPIDRYADRARIEETYRKRVLGYLYYIQTVQGQRSLGLPDDEYRDSGGFPPLLYVREGRRILGEQVPVEGDITDARAIVRPESVGLGDYPMDSHAVRPKTDWSRPDMGEGEFWLYQYTPWHQLPLGILIPRGLDNVFVTTAVSSTHVSFGTYRLEPVRMAFGQAAAIAAEQCVRRHLTARDVPVRQIQEALLPHPANRFGNTGVYLSFYKDLKPSARHYRAIQYMAARGLLAGDESFDPEAATSHADMARWLTALAKRSAPAPSSERTPYGETRVRRAYYPYMGAPADRRALASLPSQGDSKPTTIGEAARWIVRIFPDLVPAADRGRYPSDLAQIDAASALHALAGFGVPGASFTGKSDGPVDPSATLKHADAIWVLYLVNLSLGPLFNDNPVDGINGFHTPPALYETETIPCGEPSRDPR
jgi:hypothetical protein